MSTVSPDLKTPVVHADSAPSPDASTGSKPGVASDPTNTPSMSIANHTANASESSPLSPASPAETITSPTEAAPAPASIQKALQAGLNKESFEQEVGQVLGTLNSWWGGVKKQVGCSPDFQADGPECFHPVKYKSGH